MRAPPLARIAAVAAPRPDAEPVTIAHRPSFDIGISSRCLNRSPCARSYRAVAYHIARQNPGQSKPGDTFMPPSQAALRTALVIAMAFPHHKAQENTASKAWRNGRSQTRANSISGNAVAESENIVA